MTLKAHVAILANALRLLSLCYGLILISLPITASAQYTIERLPDARMGKFYAYNIAFQGLVEPLSFEWQGELPLGMGIEGPRLQGTPEKYQKEAYQFALTITDALGHRLRRRYTLQVRPDLQPLQLLTTHIPTLIRDEEVDFPIVATGGEGAYIWSTTTSGLPEGLRLDCNTAGAGCRLVGNPQTASTFRIAVSVRDIYTQTDVVTLTGAVVPPPPPPPPALSICTESLPVGNFNTPYHDLLCVKGGYPPYKWRLTWRDQARPEWLSFSPNTGFLSGIPTDVATYQLTLEVTDRLDKVARSNELTLDVQPTTNEPLRLIPVTLPAAIAGRPYVATIAAVHSQGIVHWLANRATELDWLNTVSEGAYIQLRGTPTTLGKWDLTIEARDTAPTVSTQSNTTHTFGSVGPTTYTLRVIEALRLVTDQIPPLIQGEPIDLELAAMGGEEPYQWEVDAADLPEGLTLQCGDRHATCRVIGTPLEIRPFRMTVRVADTTQRTAPTILSSKVLPAQSSPLAICSRELRAGVYDIPYYERLCVSGGHPPYHWEVDTRHKSVPRWLDINLQHGLLSGKPDRIDSYNFPVVVTDSVGVKAEQNLSLQVEHRQFTLGTWMQFWWPYALCTLMIGLIGYAAGRWRKLATVRPATSKPPTSPRQPKDQPPGAGHRFRPEAELQGSATPQPPNSGRKAEAKRQRIWRRR